MDFGNTVTLDEIRIFYIKKGGVEMTSEILTRCGYRCDLCHAYKENIMKEDKRELLSEGWNRIFGIELTPDQIYCEGCISCKTDDIKLIDSGCKVRPCVIERGYENCSQCDNFVCDILNDRIVKFDELSQNKDFSISRSDRKNFIKPYENYDRLMELKDKSGKHSRMLNKLLVPTREDMEKFIENKEVVTLWNKLHKYIDDFYNFNEIIKYGGKSFGWIVNYRYGSKSMLSLYPERNAFTVLFVFGKKELENFQEVSGNLSKETNNIIKNTEKYHDGKWIWLRVLRDEQYQDCLVLLNIKRKPKL